MTPNLHDNPTQNDAGLPRFYIPTGFLEPIVHDIDEAVALELIVIAVEDELGVTLEQMRYSYKAEAVMARLIVYRLAHVQFYIHASKLAELFCRNYTTALNQMRKAWRGSFDNIRQKYSYDDFRLAYNRVLHRVGLMGEMLNRKVQATDYEHITREVQ